MNPGFALWPSKGTTRNDMGVYGGPYRSDLPEITTSVGSDVSEVVNGFMLYQNYPNPFNPTTKISWQSPVGSWQTLKIYDVLGNEIATLVNEYKPAGNYQISFDASELVSGIYFYMLTANGFSGTKKMILMR